MRNLIDESFICLADSGTTITLSEDQTSSCQPFQLNKGQTRTLTLKVDVNEPDIHPILKNGIKKLKKAPDYIIFCENKKLPHSFYVLIIELKSGNKDDWHRQVKAGLSISEYLVGMLENYNKKKFENIQFRCLLFHTKNETSSIRKKKRTKDKSFSYNEHPIFKYQFTDKPCAANYELEMFLR